MDARSIRSCLLTLHRFIVVQLTKLEATLMEERAAAAAAAAHRASEEREVLQVLQEDNLSVKQQLSDLEKELEAKKR